VSEDCASPNQPVIWELLLYLLKDDGSGGDLVVRFSAAAAVRNCVDVRLSDTAVMKEANCTNRPFLWMLIS
jgi:hypothetical protein